MLRFLKLGLAATIFSWVNASWAIAELTDQQNWAIVDAYCAAKGAGCGLPEDDGLPKQKEGS